VNCNGKNSRDEALGNSSMIQREASRDWGASGLSHFGA
jgi:hypothetical protein